MYPSATSKTYLVTIHGEHGTKTFSISGLGPDDLERLLARVVGGENGSLQYRIVEKTQSPTLSDEAMMTLGNATMAFAAILIVTGFVEHRLRKWLKE